jgi:hypothetical protein
MISGIHTEVLLAAGYAMFLVAVAFTLELLARHSHKRLGAVPKLRLRLPA